MVALACCAILFIVAVTGLLSYLPGMSLLGSIYSGYIPMAPSTAFSFIFFAVILIIYRYRPVSGILHTAFILSAGLISLFGLLKFGEHFTRAGSSFESSFVPVLDTIGDIPVGIMSYMTGFGFFIAGIGVLIYALKNRFKKESRWAGFAVGASGGFVTFYSVLMLFGYIYKQPFLYGQGSVVPMALTTAIAFLFLGIGIITANGPRQLFTRFFAGDSTRARLLRVFIPLTILIILIKDAIDSLIEANAATLMTSTLLLFIGVTSFVVYLIAGVIGRRIDSAENDLRESEKRFRSVFDQAAMGVARLAPDGTWLNVNKKLCDIVGYSHKELLSKTFQEITHPDDLGTDLAYLHQLLADQIQTYSMEKRYLKKSGDLVWINLTVSLVRDKNNDPECFISVIEDITERKHAAGALRESNENFQQVVSSITSAVWKADIGEDGSFENQYTSPVFNELLGLPADGSAKAWDTHLSHIKPSYMEQVNAAFREAIESPGKVINLDFEVLKENGQTAWFNSKGRCFEKDGKLHIFGSTMDITEGKKVEKALQESEEKLNLIINTSPLGICTVDPLGNFLMTNLAYERMLGYSKEELSSLSFFDVTHPNDRPKNKKLFQSMFSLEAKSFYMEKRYIRKDGLQIDVAVNAIGILDDDGRVRFGTAFVDDITAHKRAEDEKEELENQLRQAQKMDSIGRLAGGVAHDFNNMLGVIIGHTDMLLQRISPDQPFYEELTEIRRAGERSADLTRQLLAFARKQTVLPQVLDLNKTVENMTKMLQRLIGEDVDLILVPNDKLWPVKIDPSQIDQILANLCVNARDAIDDVGKVTIETGNSTFDDAYCTNHAGYTPGEYVMLAVSDDGKGMDLDTLNNVFEPFFTTKESGTGLGLATVYGSVKQNLGFINIYSETSHGTTFKIYLPRHLSDAAPLKIDEPDKPVEGGAETILLVEDEPSILRMTTMMLEKMGYTVVPANSPRDAIDIAHSYDGKIQLLITDVVMPEMNGRDLARNLLNQFPNLKRLFMSGYTANVIAHHGVLDAGVNFIQKPFSVKDLKVKVRKVLEQE